MKFFVDHPAFQPPNEWSGAAEAYVRYDAVVTEDGDVRSSVSKDAVLEHCATQFAKWQLPDDVLYVDSVPLTSTGKMDKKVVRADLDAQGYILPDLRDKAG